MNRNGHAMNDHMTATSKDQVNWLLDDLIRRLAGAERAVVLSDDGLLLGRSATLERDGAERLAAMASALSSLSRGVGTTFGKGATLQAVVEFEDGYLVLTDAGSGACLALLVSVNADLGMVAYEMNVIVQQVGASMSAGPRVLPTGPLAPRSP